MRASSYKKKISDSLNTMDSATLKQAWLILKEIGTEKNIPISNKKQLEHQLAKGTLQLDKGEGTDMGTFIRGLKKKYGKA
jgi:hypothetical protein